MTGGSSIIYVLFFLSFGYLSYSEFSGDGNFGFLMAILSLFYAYQIILFLVEKRKDDWNSSQIVVDRRIFRTITSSLAISYVYILIFLLIGTVGLYNGLFSIHPANIMWGAIITSLLVFMFSQIVQRLKS